MPTVVGSLTFMSMINKPSDRRFFSVLVFMSRIFVEMSSSVQLSMKKCFITSGPKKIWDTFDLDKSAYFFLFFYLYWFRSYLSITSGSANLEILIK